MPASIPPEETATAVLSLPSILKWLAALVSGLILLGVARFLGWLKSESDSLKRLEQRMEVFQARFEAAEEDRKEFRQELLQWVRGVDQRGNDNALEIAELRGSKK